MDGGYSYSFAANKYLTISLCDIFLCLHLHVIVGGPFQHRSGDLPPNAENYGKRGGGEVSIKLKSYKPIFFFSHTFVFIGCLQANYYKSLFSDYFCFLFVVPST